MFENSPALIVIMAFAAVTGLAFVAGNYFTTEIKVQQRIAVRERKQSPKLLDGLNSVIVKYFDEKRFKVEGPVRSKLRQELLRAGFFHANATNYYIFGRLGLVVVLPLLAYLLTLAMSAQSGAMTKLGLVAIMTAVAILGPDAYIARRQRTL